MKKYIAIVALVLSGCGSTPVKEPVAPIVVKTEIQKVLIPDDVLELPVIPASIDLTTATQKDISLWIIDNETYLKSLESKLKTVKSLNK